MTSRHYTVPLPGGAMLTGLLVVLVILPLAILLPLVILAGIALGAIVTGIALLFLLPTWLLVFYCLSVRRVELDAQSLLVRSGPWRVRVGRKALEDARVEIIEAATDPLVNSDRRVSGINLGTLSVGRFRNPDGGWVFKLLTGSGDVLRITDGAGSRLELSLLDPQAFLADWHS